MNFGEMLRAKRETMKLGLRELARLIDISPTYLSRIELCHERAPSDEVILKLAEALEIPLPDIFISAQRVPKLIQENMLLDKENFSTLINDATWGE